ncbi:kxDL motif-containing protein 1 isoform X2 [Hydra vulgaris]|uniref:KxDL motif-containing protein 1 isoform X2 n=1 Tax=Hydra vulgaris TaxID=6087 RepID=A0ABM4BE72_HYDVU
MDLNKGYQHNELISLLNGLTQSKNTSGIISTQKSTLNQYEETNEMMRQFLNLSDTTYKKLSVSYATHIKTLNNLQKDLELTFKKIRALKTKLNESYPQAFQATADAIREFQLRYEMEDEKRFCSDQFDTEKKKSLTEIAEDVVETDVDVTNNGHHNIDVNLSEEDVIKDSPCNECFQICNLESNLNIASVLEIENDKVSGDTTLLQNADVDHSNCLKMNDLSLSTNELNPVSDEENLCLENK